jgi:DNA replication protein DnaC
METEKPIGEILQNQFTIKSEPEEYILEEWEETRALQHALEKARDHKLWKYKYEFGFSEMEILSKLAQINWDEEIDRNKVLTYANTCKHQELWQQERRKKEKEEKENAEKELREAWTAARFFKLMKWTAKKDFDTELVFNEGNKHLITSLCFFVSEDPRFETELGYSFKKGLLIRGTVGLGKTFLVRCIEKNELNPILILSMLDIADDIKSTGEFIIQIGNNKMIYLDDVGTEEATVNHYGTKINFFKNFIEQTYMRNKTFSKLILSTNNSFQELEQKYGFRVRSRLKDMVNIVDIQGEDMRGK